MNYSGKNLPMGFMYVLTKKEIRGINDQIENSILSVRLEGTSYSESKIADKSLLVKHAIWVYSYIVEDKVCFSLYQFGVKISNFRNSDHISDAKQSLISDIIKLIQNQKEDYIENKFTSGTIYLYVDVSSFQDPA